MKTYYDKLKDPRWQKKRLQVMNRDKWTCKKCGDTETTLNIHHLKYESGKNPWEYDNKDLVTLCEDCHENIEKLKKDNPELDFNLIRIYKSTGWSDNSIIIFISYNDICVMRIHQDGNFIVGYNIHKWDIREIVKIFRHTLKQCE